MSFWILASLLALAAMGFALAPFVRGAGSGRPKGRGPGRNDAAGEHSGAGLVFRSGMRVDHRTALRTLYRDRIEELEEEAAAGILHESSRAEVEQELGQGLLDAFGGDAASSPSRRGRAWLLAAVGIPLLALALYLRVGEPDAEMLREAAVVLELDPDRDRLELDRWRLLLEQRLRRAPEDAQSRYLLGRAYLMDGEYRRAAQSFAAAHAAFGDDPGLDLLWLQALFLADAGRLNESARRIAERVLARDPDQPVVLEIMAIDAYRGAEYRDSVALFSRALGTAVAPGRRAALEVFLRQARSMLGDVAPRIDVELIAPQAPPATATLFVGARPVGGGMPYAVVRRVAAVLPDRVRLDDAVSMNPAMPLSAANEVEVFARISLTGAALPHPGDWEWRSQPLPITAADRLALVAELGPPERPEQSD